MHERESHSAFRCLDPEQEAKLSDFGDYLLRTRLTDDRRAPYFVGWVRRFLNTPPSAHCRTAADALGGYLEELEKRQRETWQVDQARSAVQAWLGWNDLSPEERRPRLLDLNVSEEGEVVARELRLEPQRSCFTYGTTHVVRSSRT